MKIIHCVLFLIFVGSESWFFSQTSEISQIQELNQLIVKETESFETKKTSLNNEITISQKRMENFEMLANKLQLSLEKFEVNQSNIDVFNSLKDKIIYVPTDYSDKKSKKSVKKLNDNFKILLDTNYFMIGKNLVYYEKDKRGKAIQLKELELDSKTSKMIQKLNFKEIYSPISNSKFPADLNNTAAFLFKLTGVNEDYFLIKNEIGKMKDSVSIESNFIKTKTKKIEELQKDFATTITGIKDKIKTLEEQLRKIEDEQIRLKKIEQEKAIAQQNSELYKCKNINGVDIYLGPILIKEFRNGDVIKEARTSGEWEDFVKNKTPAYKYIDFDSKNSSKGLVYNYFAYLDNREIAPIGFHKINILDFVQLEGQKIGEYKKVTEDCWCENGKAQIYERCTNCNYWTDTQKKYNVCSKCKNTNYIKRGMKKCDNCNGTTKYVSEKCENCNQKNLKIEHCIENNTGLRRIGNNRTMYSECAIDYEGQLYSIKFPSEEDENEEFCFFIIKNAKIDLLADNSVKIGQLQMMNTLLNVTKFKNGDPIQYIEDKIEWELANKNGKPAYCYYNNDKSNPCFYNSHAVNDKRGLLPGDWRMISGYDIIYVESFFNKEISFLNGTLPFKKPPGYRNEIGQFLEYKPDYTNSYDTYEKKDFDYMNFKLNSDYFYDTRYKLNQDFQKQGGYVLCVRRYSNFDDVNSVKAKNSDENNPFGYGTSGGGSSFGPYRNDVSVNGIGAGEFGDGPSGSGSGSGSGKSRKRLSNVSLPSYDVDYDCSVSFKLSINENGDVESASCIKSKTTCTDQQIINQVISEIIKQVKYEKSIGSSVTYAFYTVLINSK